MKITGLKLIHKKDGSFKIRAYDSDKYLVRMYNDGVDTSATVQCVTKMNVVICGNISCRIIDTIFIADME